MQAPHTSGHFCHPTHMSVQVLLGKWEHFVNHPSLSSKYSRASCATQLLRQCYMLLHAHHARCPLACRCPVNSLHDVHVPAPRKGKRKSSRKGSKLHTLCHLSYPLILEILRNPPQFFGCGVHFPRDISMAGKRAFHDIQSQIARTCPAGVINGNGTR
jgi:hypothetical protein